jgi:hypothetical protein
MNAIVDGNHTGRAVGHDHGDGKRADAFEPFFQHDVFLFNQGLDATHASTQGNADAFTVVVGDFQAGLADGFAGGDGG